MSNPIHLLARRAGGAAVLAAAVGVTLLGACAPSSAPEAGAGYVQEIEQWREGREERLRSENGWLSLVGLHWLRDGENSFGSDPGNDVVLAAEGVAGTAGVIEISAGSVSLRAAADAAVTVDGEPVTTVSLRTDADEEGAQVVGVGRLRMHVIERGGRKALRVRDAQSPVRLEFDGIESYPIDAAYRFAARFKPYDPPRRITFPTVLGTEESGLAPGLVEFDLDGRTYGLEPIVNDPAEEQWFYIFNDLTSADETYGAGRFLYAPAPVDGVIDLDFNRAYNPPCAFTPFATCPLPPRQNWLDVRIEAGEKRYGDH
jgi:uncharacterized protein (DUF1684 family)